MKWPRVRFSIGRMMVAVAVFAILIPFPIRAIAAVLGTLVFWFPALVLDSWFDQLAPSHPGRFAALGLICVAGAGVWLLGLYPGTGKFLEGAAYGGLTVANLAEPFHAARRFLRGGLLTSGHLLWAWSGLIWSADLSFPGPHSRDWELQMMVECTRPTLVFAVLSALYGRRPAPGESAWAHRAGWIVVESDMLAWGWYASRFLW